MRNDLQISKLVKSPRKSRLRMDESGKKQFLQLIDQIKNHKIIIIVSHDNAILNTCDEILIL